MDRFEDLHRQLLEARAERDLLREENTRLKELLGLEQDKKNPPTTQTLSEPPVPFIAQTGVIHNESPREGKIALFRSLFHGREEVYPVRW
jgi:hypothetical protein